MENQARGRTWSGLEVNSGTESLEGVLAMMEGESGNGSLEGEFLKKGSLEGTLGLGSGNVWK